MAEDAANPFYFTWVVRNPFMPWRTLTTTFYSSLTKWVMNLEPVTREAREWEFAFSIGCDQPDEDCVIVAEKIKVYISEKQGFQKLLDFQRGYSFCQTNRHTYRCLTSILPGRRQLKIKIVMFLPNPNLNVAYREVNKLQYDGGHIADLSMDLRRLVTHPLYFNMRLKASDRNSPFPVHSYIILKRWGNFFLKHPLRADSEDAVEVNISGKVLATILIYVYSGFLDPNGLVLNTDIYRTELFQVIDGYDMRHFHHLFRCPYSSQVRMTVNEVFVFRNSFRLNDARVRQRKYRRFQWYNTSFKESGRVVLKIVFIMDQDNPRFSYKLRYKTRHESRLYARVKLQYQQSGEGISKLVRVADHYYTIDSNRSVESGTCRLKGLCPSLYHSGEGRAAEVTTDHDIKCILHLSDGTMIMHINSEKNIEIDEKNHSDQVLSNHMYELLMQRIHGDLRVVCRHLESRDDAGETHLLHKAIFAARVPKWWTVLLQNGEEVPEGNDIPDQVTCDFFSEAFRHVVDYIYTGKTVHFPNVSYDEIIMFAKRCQFERLINYMEIKLRSNELDQQWLPMTPFFR